MPLAKIPSMMAAAAASVAIDDRIDDPLVPAQRRLAILRLDRRLRRNEARNAASITFPIERMNGLPDALAAICKARSASAKATESEASRYIRSMLCGVRPCRLRNAVRLRARPRAARRPDRSREVAEEALVDAGIEMPCEHVGIEHVPGAALPHHGADPRLGAEADPWQPASPRSRAAPAATPGTSQ